MTFSIFWKARKLNVNPMAAPNSFAVFPMKVQFSKRAKWLSLLSELRGPAQYIKPLN